MRTTLGGVCLLLTAVGLSSWLTSCTSRTLPLPPPEVASVSSPNGDGNVTVSGFALENASVGVVNDRTLEGTITTSPNEKCDGTCKFTATLPAKPGDTLRVWQFFETPNGKEAEVPK